MAAPQISMLPPAPSRADDGPSFSAKADAFVAALANFRSEANTQADFTDLRAISAEEDAIATAADRVQTGLDRAVTTADRTQTGLDRAATGADRVQTGLDRAATAADRVQTGLDRAKTTADAAATAADRVQTGLDRAKTTSDAAATAADRVATAADRVQTGLDRTQTGLDRTATAADRVQTGLDRVETAADRVQTGLDRAQTTADKNAVNAALALATDRTITYVATVAEARALVGSVPDGGLIYIVNDERYTPPRRTLNRVSRDPNGALTADFLIGTYQADDIVAFLNFDTPQLVDVPANSAAPGFNGAFAVNATHFYFYANTQWLRIAGSTF